MCVHACVSVCVSVCVGWSQTLAQGRIRLGLKSLVGARCEVLMRQPSLGRAGLELTFGWWCRGWLTVVSTHGGGGPDVTAQAGLERVSFTGE